MSLQSGSDSRDVMFLRGLQGSVIKRRGPGRFMLLSFKQFAGWSELGWEGRREDRRNGGRIGEREGGRERGRRM